MLQIGSIIKIKDNSGVIAVKCFRTGIKLGDVISCSVVKLAGTQSSKSVSVSSGKKGKGGSISLKNYKRGDVVHVLVTNTCSSTSSEGGIRTKYGENTGVLMGTESADNPVWLPIGTRITGAVPRSLRNKGWSNIVAMAETLI